MFLVKTTHLTLTGLDRISVIAGARRAESITFRNSGFLQVDRSETYGVESAVLAVNTKMRCGEPVATLITPYKQYPELIAD